jgi:hypothetical protein
MRRYPFPLFGVVAGALFFLMLLHIENGTSWPLQQSVGCSITPAFRWINAPAEALVWVFPNRVIAPQSAGIAARPADPAWSPTLFLAWGLAWYAVAGFVVGLMVNGYWIILSSSRRR